LAKQQAREAKTTQMPPRGILRNDKLPDNHSLFNGSSMRINFMRLTNSILLGIACVSPVYASSTAGSSAADSASSATSSASDSLKTSSNGSSKATGIAQGEYKIIAIQQTATGKVQLTLEALNGKVADEVTLFVPQKIFDAAQLNLGQTIAAKTRSYGVEFSRSYDGKAFLLVLEDAIYKELHSVAVSL
jgi:hypothetical protein